ncbi:MAG TPA: mannonate dehydratase [Cyclobacteriaceae bacterium]|nr:mannonate dehydratase [Cyclobacteriaceae bacterium]
MKNNRRNFIKKSASLAATVSIAGMGSGIAGTLDQKLHPTEARKIIEVAKDGGMEFSLSLFGFDSPRIALAKQMGIYGAVHSVRGTDELKPWDPKAITAVKEGWEKLGMKWNVVEGPPTLGEKTKLGLEGRDEEIENFITFMKNLKQYGGVDIICYNWMPVVSWFRTKMDTPGRGGALVTSFDNEDSKKLPVTKYGEVSKETLWKNLEYFLKAVVPEAEKIGMNLSLHPDDPQVDSIKGISRIMTSVENFDRMLNIVPSKYSGLTMCQGNFSLMGADIPSLVRRWGKAGKINYVHFRNVRDLSGQKPSIKFTETFHDEGQIDMYAAMKAYYDIGYKGPIRPDHVPTMAGDTNEHPGYSTIGTLFAIGYMRGLIESISKSSPRA